MTHTDRELLAAYLAGNQNAFRALADRYVGLVYAAAQRQAGPQSAEDVAQAVFLLLARRASTLRHPELLPSWLLKVTRYCAAEARRSAARRRHHEQKAAAMAPTAFTDPPVADPLEPHLDAALDSLSPPDRTALLLRYFDNHSLAEVAHALDISEEAAKKRVARAVEKLRKHFLRKNLALALALPVLAATLARQASAAPPHLASHIAAAALAKSTTPTAALLIAKGAAKLMAYTPAKLAAVGVIGVLLVTAVAAPLIIPRPPVPLRSVPPPLAAAPAAPPPASAPPVVHALISALALPHDPIPTVNVTDLATHAPLGGATITIMTRAETATPLIDASPTTATTAPDGTARLPYPATLVNNLAITASKEGYVPVEIRWKRNFPVDTAPDHFSFQLEKAIPIGGRIVDLQGNPLAGATVLVLVQKQYQPNAQVSTTPFTAVTNAEGQWSLTAIPETYDHLLLGASHPLCLDGSGFVTLDFAATPNLAQLRARTHILQLERGTLISGTVYAPDGKPHPAAITVGAWTSVTNHALDILTTKDGHFQFATRAGTHTFIAVHAPGFGSVLTDLTPADQPLQLDLTLAPPKPLTAHIIDSHGNPILNATVSIDHWSDASSHLYVRDFPLTLISDAAGNITWPEAPDKPITAFVAARGYLSRAETPLSPGTPNDITLFPQPIVRVHTRAALAGEKIPDARLVLGTADHRYHDQPQWLDLPERRPSIRPQPDGSQLLTFDQQHDSLLIRAAGDHFLPTDSPPLPLDGHDYDITFTLPEGDRLAGQLVDSDGAPVTNTPVWLTPNFLDIYDAKLPMDKASRESDPAHYAITDRDGNFSFPPQKDAYLLIVATDQGYTLIHDKQFSLDTTLVLHPWATVQGILLTNNAPARAGIPVRASTPSYYSEIGPDPQYSAITDAAGHFTFTHVFAGEYRLEVDPDVNQKSATEKTFKIRPGQTTTLTLHD